MKNFNSFEKAKPSIERVRADKDEYGNQNFNELGTNLSHIKIEGGRSFTRIDNPSLTLEERLRGVWL